MIPGVHYNQKDDGAMRSAWHYGSYLQPFGPQIVEEDACRKSLLITIGDGIPNTRLAFGGRTGPLGTIEIPNFPPNIVYPFEFLEKDYPGLVTAEVWNPFILQSEWQVVEAWCSRDLTGDLSAYCCKDGMYQTTSVTRVIAAAAGFVQFVGGNGNRVSLFVSVRSIVPANDWVQLSTVNSALGEFLYVSPGTSQGMTYRDYGPIIREPIWGRVLTGPLTVVLTETYQIPNSKSRR